MSERWFRFRIAVIGGIFGLLFLVTLARAYDIQTREAPTLTARARKMYSREYTFPGARGAIYDRDMRALAVTLSVDSIFADPQLFPEDPEEREEAAEALSQVLKLDKETVSRRLASQRRFVWLKRFATPEEVSAVRTLGLPGVDTVPEYRRFYPNRELAGHLLGFVNLGGDAEGLERSFDALLTGSTGSVPIISDSSGEKIFSEGTVAPTNLEGSSLVLTLSSQIQYLAERELKKAIEETGSLGGTVVAADPRTGEILALANWPTFNPNEPGLSKADQRRNRAVTDPFEPGSTLKSFVYAAALEEGLITPEGEVDCTNGSIKVGRHTIHDSHRVGRTTWAGSLAKSSNICAYKLGSMLGAERLYEYLRAFGFGQPSGLNLPGESAGVLRSPEKWREINLATISFGHGITVTALQQVIAMGAIANKGMLMEPRLIKRIIGPNGDVRKEFHPEVRRRPISPETAEVLSEMLLGVTRPGGTAQRAALSDYAVAGKTGTAQKVVAGVYEPGHFVSSFVGFAPAKNPRLVVAVVLDDPVGAYYGGQVAAPVFQAVVEESLRAMGVPAEPDPLARPQGSTPATSPLLPLDEEPSNSSPSQATSLPVPWQERQGGEGVPDFTGLTMADALKLARARGIELFIEGSGIATRQDPPPGEAADAVTVTFDKE